MNKLLLVLCFLVSGLLFSVVEAVGNNVRTEGETKVRLNVTEDSLLISFKLSWDNSWRDEYNWDAVWLFVKCKKQDMGGIQNDWWHLELGNAQTGTANLDIQTGNTGNAIVGVFVYPRNKGHFNISGEEITLRAPLNGIPVSDIKANRYFFAVTGIEMVMIPYGDYYLGDNYSKGTFRSLSSTTIKPEDDIIGTDPNFVYSAEPAVYFNNMSPAAAANRENNPYWNDKGDNIWYCGGTGLPAAQVSQNIYWMVDFGTPKTIRTFGVSYGVDYDGSKKTYFVPTQDWYLQGTNSDPASNNWVTLATVTPAQTVVSQNSYPVQGMIKVDVPGAYRYYRLYFPQLTKGLDACEIANVAMSEEDLFEKYARAALMPEVYAMNFGTDYQLVYSKDGTESGQLALAYPKGFTGFYVMKYEVSQEQYVNFLNMLNYKQQKVRIGNDLDALTKGQYVFGDPSTPSARNGIALFEKEANRAAVFANNLNPALPYFEVDDGQTLACNYMTPEDMLAYLDWAGLRPLSEMEYEKMARAPERYLPGEYAWNTTTIHPLPGMSAVVDQGSETEKASDIKYNVNARGLVPGPVRNGAFARSLPNSTNQVQAGASFWGVMELSGNLAEMYYSVSGGSGFAGMHETNLSHGNGEIAFNGTNDMGTYWPDASTPDAFILKGGSFQSPDSLLRISDRSMYVTDYEKRDSTVTFRGGRGMWQGMGEYTQAGSIVFEGDKTVACIGEPIKIIGDEEPEQSGLKVRYLWWERMTNADGSWSPFYFLPGETGKDLIYKEFDNVFPKDRSYQFQRCAYYGTGVHYCISPVITVPNTACSVWGDVAINLGLCPDGRGYAAVSSYQTNGTFEWSYMGNPLTANVAPVNPTVTGQGSFYYPTRSDFGVIPASGMVAEVICTYTIDGCKNESRIKINIEPMTDLCTDYTTPDADGNTYAAGLKLGCRCWMRENINVGNIVSGTDRTTHTAPGIQRICYNNDPAYCETFGGLYSWKEAVSGGLVDDIKYNANGDIQGICPDGWHLPSDEEWKKLEMDLGLTAPYVHSTGWRGTDQGIQLKSTDFWKVASNAGTNSSHMDMRPGGMRNPTTNTYWTNILDNGYWWTATLNSTTATYRQLNYAYKTVLRHTSGALASGYSVRCVKDL